MHKHRLIQCLKPVSRAVSEKTLMSASSLIFEAIDSPRSLAAHLLLKNKEYAQLVSLEINPNNYTDAHAFADDYLATKFLSKFPDFRHRDLDPKKAALQSFHEYEALCKETNRRFKSLALDPSQWDPEMHSILLMARRKIKAVLGRPDLSRIAEGFGWGPGATTVAKGSYTSAYIKYAQRLDVTSNTLVMGHCCINSVPSWVNCQLQTDEFPSVPVSLTREAFHVVRGNEIVFVPKNAKTHRIIAKEPHVNSYLQKGFGSYIRERLRIAADVDLKDQTYNQRLAKEGSLKGNLATIDLSGASDTISQELVRFLLPKQWFSLLDQIRSKQGFLREENVWIYYHKFSSMGNACTFELESLLFWAICKSCLEYLGGEQVLNVYGDDIVVPVDAYGLVAKVIDFVGFKLNSKKSYSSGKFRESCGKDFFDGIDVRPIFLKESISNAESLFKLANSVRRYAHRRNFGYGCDVRLRPCWLHVVSLVPDELRDLKIPEHFGDVGTLVNFDEACPSRPHPVKQAGWEGFVFKGLTRHPVKLGMRDSHAGYTATLSANRVTSKDYLEWSNRQALPSLTSRPPKVIPEGTPLLGHHDLRKMTYPKITRIHTHGWYDLGPWL